MNARIYILRTGCEVNGVYLFRNFIYFSNIFFFANLQREQNLTKNSILNALFLESNQANRIIQYLC